MSTACPACALELVLADGTWTCGEGHAYSAVALALATNSRALSALWAALRALEDDAFALLHLADRGETSAAEGQARRREAEAAQASAAVLRGHAQAAKRRVDALLRDSSGRPDATA